MREWDTNQRDNAEVQTIHEGMMNMTKFLGKKPPTHRAVVNEAYEQREHGEKERPDCSCDVCSVIRKLRISAGVQENKKGD